MIYVGENKSILCKGNFRPAQLYKGDKKITGYELTAFEGTGSVTLENCYNDKIYDTKLSVGEAVQVTVRGKNYFNLNNIQQYETTMPYNNGLTAKKTTSSNRCVKIPISLPMDKTIHMTMNVVDSKIDGTVKYVTMGIYNSSETLVGSIRISSTIEKKSYSFTLTREVSYIQFYFQFVNTSNAVGDYVTMDNIMIRCEGDDTFESYIEPQTVSVENGNITDDIPTFKGTTIIEIESDAEATISGKYKKMEVE